MRFAGLLFAVVVFVSSTNSFDFSSLFGGSSSGSGSAQMPNPYQNLGQNSQNSPYYAQNGQNPQYQQPHYGQNGFSQQGPGQQQFGQSAGLGANPMSSAFSNQDPVVMAMQQQQGGGGFFSKMFSKFAQQMANLFGRNSNGSQ